VLSKNKPDRVFIGPRVGRGGDADGGTHSTLGLGTGFETLLTGCSLFDNVDAGFEVYYPTYCFLSQTIWFGGGVFISYNFQSTKLRRAGAVRTVWALHGCLGLPFDNGAPIPRIRSHS